MQAQGVNWAQGVTLALGVILVLGMFFYLPKLVPEPVEIPPFPEIPEVVVPTAAEIAAEVNVPTLRNNNFDDILEGVYPDEVEDLEEDCQEGLHYEFMDDIEDDMEEVIEAELGEDIKDISVVDFNWDDEYLFTVLNLGLDDEDDREGEIFTILRVKYHEVFGDSDWHFEKVEAIARCFDWDSSDDEFEDLTVDYNMA